MLFSKRSHLGTMESWGAPWAVSQAIITRGTSRGRGLLPALELKHPRQVVKSRIKFSRCNSRGAYLTRKSRSCQFLLNHRGTKEHREFSSSPSAPLCSSVVHHQGCKQTSHLVCSRCERNWII